MIPKENVALIRSEWYFSLKHYEFTAKKYTEINQNLLSSQAQVGLREGPGIIRLLTTAWTNDRSSSRDAEFNRSDTLAQCSLVEKFDKNITGTKVVVQNPSDRSRMCPQNSFETETGKYSRKFRKFDERVGFGWPTSIACATHMIQLDCPRF